MSPTTHGLHPNGDGEEPPGGVASGMAYGLVFRGVDGEALSAPDPHAETVVSVTVTINGADAQPRPRQLDDDAAVLDLIGGQLVLDRRQATAAFHMPAAIGPHELVHPYLSPVASIFNWWLGRVSFHAGAFVFEGRAWGLLGEREAGKSTTLAWLHGQGLGVVADDMVVVVDGAVAHTGPRSLDLRPRTAEFLASQDLVVVREGQRSRLHLPPLARTHPVGGWVVLEEGPEVEVVPVPPAERLSRLAGQLAIRRPPADPAELLSLASLPMWVWRRPRRFDDLGEAVAELLDVIGGA